MFKNAMACYGDVTAAGNKFNTKWASLNNIDILVTAFPS